MVVEFVYATLNINLKDSQFDTLSEQEKSDDQNRQDTLQNKAENTQYFVKTFGNATNITQSNNIENDPAYLASIEILKNIDSTSSSLSDARATVTLNSDGILESDSTSSSSVNTSTVVFDLVNGNSSSHSERVFDPAVAYTIYIRVDIAKVEPQG